MKTPNIERLYGELDHLANAEYIITRAVKAAADDLAASAANDPDERTQRRGVLGNAAFDLRMATGQTKVKALAENARAENG